MQLHLKYIYTFSRFQYFKKKRKEKDKILALSADPEERHCLVKEGKHLALKENVGGKVV